MCVKLLKVFLTVIVFVIDVSVTLIMSKRTILSMILRKLTLTIIFILIVIAVITSLIVLKVKGVEKTGRVLKVFCAGSLKIPLDKLAEKFEKLYGVKVHIEASGSVEAIRKIIDLGRCSDVLVVADYELIPLMMIPKYADWYIAFASNEVVLAYTDKSRYRDLLSKNLTSWFNVLMKNDVYYGFSDPNKDPCGYRSIGILILASLYYKNLTIMRKLLLEKTNIKVKFLGDEIHIYIPPNLEVTSRSLIVKPKSVDLISLLEIGELDYAFEYKSVAIQHKLNYVELPDEINLGNPKYEKFYSKIVIH